MALNYPFLFRFLLWSACSFYLWRTSLFPGNEERRGKLDRFIRFFGAITTWLAVVAFGRGFGLFRYVF